MASMYRQAVQHLNRDVRYFFVSSALFGFTIFGGINAVILNLYLLRLGYGPEFIGLFNAAGLLAIAIFSLPAGMLGGHWGCRSTMIAGMSLILVGNGLVPVGELVPAGIRAAWLVVMNVCGNVGVALYIVNTSPFLVGATGTVDRNHAFSLQAALWPMAGFGGSLVGGVLPGLFAQAIGASHASATPYRYTLWLSAGLLVIAIVALLQTREQRAALVTERATAPGPAPLGLIALITLVVLLQVSGEGIARTFFNVYLDSGLKVPTAQIGLLTGAGQLVAVPAALLTPLLAERWGLVRTFTVGTVGMALSLLPLALIANWGAAGLGFMGMVALASVTRPAMSVYQMELVAPRWQTTMAGAGILAVALSWAAMAFGGGYLIAAVSYRFLFLLGASVTLAGGLLFWVAFRTRPRLALPLPT